MASFFDSGSTSSSRWPSADAAGRVPLAEVGAIDRLRALYEFQRIDVLLEVAALKASFCRLDTVVVAEHLALDAARTGLHQTPHR